MINQDDLNTFQSCRLKWKLSQELGIPTCKQDPYLIAIKRTIFQMYTWLQEKDKLMSEIQIRERWDKNWITDGLNPQTDSNIINKAISGWQTVRNFWENYYLTETYLTPIATNFEFSTYIHEVHYRIHADIILVTKKGDFTLRQLGPRRAYASLYNLLDTKLELIGCAKTLNVPTLTKSYVNIQSTSPNEITLQPTQGFIDYAQATMDDVSRSIANHIFYASPNPGCSSCQFYQRCLKQGE